MNRQDIAGRMVPTVAEGDASVMKAEIKPFGSPAPWREESKRGYSRFPSSFIPFSLDGNVFTAIIFTSVNM